MKKQIILALVGLMAATACIVAALAVVKDYSVKRPIQIQEDNVEAAVPDAGLKPVSALQDDTPVNPDPTDKITAKTKIIYEYYYTGDGVTERTEELAPYFLIDMTRKNIEEMFFEWTVTSFSSDKVVMRKDLAGSSSQYFIVGVHDGYIAVFYAGESNGSILKEVTERPVAALPAEEQQRLKSGIRVLGQDALAKVLEDYSS